MKPYETNRKRFLGLTVFLSLLALASLAVGIVGSILMAFQQATVSKKLSLALILGGFALFLTCIVLIIITRAAARKLAYEGSYESEIDRYYARGAGQVVYVTHDGTLLSKTQYEALCLLMDECRSGRITKYEYCEAKKRILAMK